MTPEYILDSIRNYVGDFNSVLTINGSEVIRVTAESDGAVHVYTRDGSCFTFKGRV